MGAEIMAKSIPHHGHDCILVGRSSGAVSLQDGRQVHVGDRVTTDQHKVTLDYIALVDDAERLAGRRAVGGHDGCHAHLLAAAGGSGPPLALIEVLFDLIGMGAAEDESLRSRVDYFQTSVQPLHFSCTMMV